MRIEGKPGFAEIASVMELSVSTVHDKYRRVDCNWESPFREMGWETLLPHLEPM
jgi:hypothetical protein